MTRRTADFLILLAVASLTILAIQTELSGTVRQSKTDSGTSQSSSVHVSSQPTIGPNIGIVGETAPDRQQVEVTIAVDPHNPNVLVTGAQDLRLKPTSHRWHGYYRSTDAGKTWTNSLIPGFPGDTSPQGLTSPLHSSNATSDPVLTFDRLGNVYYAGLALNISSTGPVGNQVAFVAKYTNDGATYSGVTMITGPFFADKEWIVTDNTGGPNDGNVYLAYDASLGSPTAPFATIFTRSTDGGRTFSQPFYVPADQTGGLPGVTVDSAGNVYVSSDAFNPVSGANLNYIQVSKLTNGGTTLVQNVRAVNPTYWLTGPPKGADFRGFTIPQIAADNNGVYLVFDDVREGNSSIYFTSSVNGGSIWSPPIRVNDGNRGEAFFPTIAVAGGIINVAWYDSRANTGATMTTLDVFYSASYSANIAFSPSVRVTDVSFNPDGVRRTDMPYSAQTYFMGDYIGITATPTTAYPIWADNRNMCDTFDPTWGCVDQDAYTTTITVSVSPRGNGGGGGRAPLQK